jgi:hypothetical protein
MSTITRQSLIVYIFINITLIFSVALPAAGMINHLLPHGVPDLGRAFSIWLAGIFTCLTLTLALLPAIRRRVSRRSNTTG